MKQTILQRIALLFPATCKRLTENDTFDDEECSRLESLLPFGSGINAGMTIDIELSTRKTVVLRGDYHNINDDGYYDGWFSFRIDFHCNLATGVDCDVKFTKGTANLSKSDIVTYYSDYLCDTVFHVVMGEA